MASRIEGLEELQRKLTELGRAAGGKVLRNSVASAIRPALNRAKATVPVGTVPHKTYKGRLVAPGFAQRSLRIKSVLSRDRTFARAMLGVRPEAFYAVQFIELGTAKMPARPWLVPAFESTIDQQTEALRIALKKRIDKVRSS